MRTARQVRINNRIASVWMEVVRFSSIGMAKAALEALNGFNLYGDKGSNWSVVYVDVVRSERRYLELIEFIDVILGCSQPKSNDLRHSSSSRIGIQSSIFPLLHYIPRNRSLSRIATLLFCWLLVGRLLRSTTWTLWTILFANVFVNCAERMVSSDFYATVNTRI